MRSDLSVSILDVGQGDSILIQTPEYKNILIDAGENGQVIEELDKTLSFFNRKIDLAIITHPHRDHFGGFLEIIDKYPIKQIILTGAVSHDPVYTDLINKIQSKNIPIFFPQNNKDFKIGKISYLDILYPFEGVSLIGQETDNLNNTSIVLKLVEKNSCHILLAGDAEHELEREIILAGHDINCPILKLGHHGSRTATSDIFLSAVNPQTAIVSAGLDNKFEHPHQETLDKLSNIEVLQTIDGTITFNF